MSLLIQPLQEDDPLFQKEVDYDLDFTGEPPDEDQPPAQQPMFGMNQGIDPMQEVPEDTQDETPVIPAQQPEQTPVTPVTPEPEYKMGQPVNEMADVPDYTPWDVEQDDEPEQAPVEDQQTEQTPWWKAPVTFEQYDNMTGGHELSNLFRQMEPVKDEKTIKTSKRFAAINSLGEAMRSVAEAVGVSKGGLATKRTNDLIDKAIARIDKEESDYKTMQRAHKMLMLNNQLQKWNGYRNYLQQQMKDASDMDKLALKSKDDWAKLKAQQEFNAGMEEYRQGNMNARTNADNTTRMTIADNNAKLSREKIKAAERIAKIRASSSGKGGSGKEDGFPVMIDGKKVVLTPEQYYEVASQMLNDPATYEMSSDRIPVTEKEIDLTVSKNAGKFYDGSGNRRSGTPGQGSSDNDGYIAMRPSQIDPNTAAATLENIVSSNITPEQKREMLKQLFEVSPPTSQMLSDYNYDIDAMINDLLQ